MQTEVRQGRPVGLLLHLEPLPEIHVKHTNLLWKPLKSNPPPACSIFCLCPCAFIESHAETGVTSRVIFI